MKINVVLARERAIKWTTVLRTWAKNYLLKSLLKKISFQKNKTSRSQHDSEKSFSSLPKKKDLPQMNKLKVQNWKSLER